MSTLNVFQVSLEIWGCMFSVIVAMVTGAQVYQRGSALKTAWILLLLNALTLTADSFAYVFQGDVTVFGCFITRISNFFLYFFEGAMAWHFALYVHEVTGAKTRWTKSPIMKGLLALVLIELIGCFMNLFTNFYYSFDEVNRYHREFGANVAFLTLGLVVGISCFRMYIHRLELPDNVWKLFRMSIIVFFSCYILQVMQYLFSFINIALTVILLVQFLNLYNNDWHDNIERQMDELETTIEELRDRLGEQ